MTTDLQEQPATTGHPEPLALRHIAHIGSQAYAELAGLAWALDPASATREPTTGESEAYASRYGDPAWSWLYQGWGNVVFADALRIPAAADDEPGTPPTAWPPPVTAPAADTAEDRAQHNSTALLERWGADPAETAALTHTPDET